MLAHSSIDSMNIIRQRDDNRQTQENAQLKEKWRISICAGVINFTADKILDCSPFFFRAWLGVIIFSLKTVIYFWYTSSHHGTYVLYVDSSLFIEPFMYILIKVFLCVGFFGFVLFCIEKDNKLKICLLKNDLQRFFRFDETQRKFEGSLKLLAFERASNVCW